MKYVRSVYYEQEHPFRFQAISAVIMAAILWLVLRGIDGGSRELYQSPWQYALVYSASFSAVRVWKVHRPKARWRFRRWATKHPTPDQLADPAFVEAMLDRRPLPRGSAFVRWCGWTLLSFVFLFILLGIVVESIVPQRGGQPSPLGPIVALVCAAPAIVVLRLYWPPLRDWPRAVPEIGWYADPAAGHELRYWDGSQWTEHVSDHGTQSIDPIQ
ncbi:MAG TPA: DUF2510 domain-containing protein [Acidimicrobiia bacterium]|nr:DUF2510 domain-containing protein [Acidimicrobiia bacterium]